MNPKTCLRGVFAYCVAAVVLLANCYCASYVNDFSSSTLDRMTLNGGTRTSNGQPYPAIENGYLALVYAENNEVGTAVLDDLTPGKAITSFDMTYNVLIGGGSIPPADGMSVFLGNIDSTARFGEPGPADGANGIKGLTISFDIFNNTGDEAPSIDVKVNGNIVAHKPYDIAGITTDSFAPVMISWKQNSLLTVTYKGEPVFTDLSLQGYAPAVGDRFAIGARTGGLFENQWIDDLNIIIPEPRIFWLTGLGIFVITLKQKKRRA